MFDQYPLNDGIDEMFAPGGKIRPWYKVLAETLNRRGMDDLKQRQMTADAVYVSMGITFNVYHESGNQDRTLPFDVIPRIIPKEEWDLIRKGLEQRIVALDTFLFDIYGKKQIIKDRVIPEDIITSSPGYCPQCAGISPPGGRWIHVSGIDLIKHTDGQTYVLEDNLRVPSGVSYVLANREIIKRIFPELLKRLSVAPVYNYTLKLLEILQQLSVVDHPNVAVLTPGIYNSAYFEHSFLAQQMGAQLVEGRDLIVKDNFLYVITTRGLQKVDVLYRRIDDDYLDPKYFRKDSLLGVYGLLDAFRAGNVVIANAPGTGVADDKVVCAYVPKMIEYYLDEKPLLPNVTTYLCWDKYQRDYVLKNLEQMVVKTDNQAGGYGMLIGNSATSEELDDFRQRIKTKPRAYVAQPIMSLSQVPTVIGDAIEPRHVDLRPFILYGKEKYILPGGLSRVALRKGSLVVNSSQGGGSKDAWVLQQDQEDDGC